MSRALLCLNLLILLTHFALAWGAAASSNAALRTTGRIVGQLPAPRRAAAPAPGRRLSLAARPEDWPVGRAAGGAPARAGARAGASGPGDRAVAVRLARFLDRIEAADRLTGDQVAALYREVERCADAMRDAVADWGRRAPDGARARRRFGALRRRLGRETENALRRAALDERDLLDRLVRVVLASAG